MANPGEIFITFEKPKETSKAFFFVSEGLLSALHLEHQKKNVDLKGVDSSRRSLLHYSGFLNLHAISLYLLMAGVDPYLIDKTGQSWFFGILAKGNFRTLQTVLNYFQHVYRKELNDWITLLKFGFSMQNITLRNTIALYLAKSITFNKIPEKPIESKSELSKRVDIYFKKILDLYKFILCTQDSNRRNPLHYASLSKFTWSYKAIEVILEDLEGFPSFIELFYQVQPLFSSQKIDPSRYSSVLQDTSEILGAVFDRALQEHQENMKKIKISALNAKDVNGQTPLHLACYAGDFKVVKLLVKHGADKSARDRKNLRPLDLCSNKMVMKHLSSLPEVVSQKDEAGMKDFVNSGFDLNFSNNSYLMTSLHYAVMNGGLVNKVIALTGDVNQCDWNNYTPLHLACIQGKLEDAKILIENQANVMAKSSSGLTPLHLACKFDRVSLVQPLIESGADKDAVDNHSRTPLMIAAKHGSVKCVKELLAEKCNFRKTDERLWNALHYASFHCKNLVVKVLVKWNADDHELLGMRNSQGMTPQELTTDVKTRKAFQTIWNAARNGDVDTMRKLLRKGCPVNEATVTQRKTALMMAAISNHFQMARFLIQERADANLFDTSGRKALDYLTPSSDPKLKSLLLANTKQRPSVPSYNRSNSG